MALPVAARSLSARLLVLTIFFVMLAEILIYTPSIARFRLTWLEERLAAGHLAALAVTAAPAGMVTRELRQELLDHVGAAVIKAARPGQETLMLGAAGWPTVDHTVDLRERMAIHLIADAYDSLFRGGGRTLHLIGVSPRDPGTVIEMILEEAPLTAAMRDYSWRILGLSVVISLITASLVFLSLRWLLVTPMRRFTAKMMAFREDPEDAANIIVPAGRTDEVGVAERELRDMQIAVRAALRQQARLAALGAGVTRINHDLRNILSTAALLSERLGQSDDPEVRRITPRLLDALNRAVDLCRNTLVYTRENGPPVQRAVLNLHALVDAAALDLSPVLGDQSRWVNAVDADLTVTADREQLLRVLVNLGHNAFQAGAATVTVTAETRPGRVLIVVADDGPGLAPRAREHLFRPFAGAGRPGGTGLGLAIAREIMVAHRGDLRLVETDAQGTRFELELPA